MIRWARLSPLVLIIVAAPPHDLGAQTVEVDHIFIFVEPGAPEVEALREAGFTVLPQVSRHTGQGTASISIAFRNAYLELIWVDDANEFADNDFGIPERRAAPEGSPFGLGLRRVAASADLPFATEPYREVWMPPGQMIWMATWSGSVGDPLVFVVPASMTWESAFEQVPQLEALTRHELGVERLTAVRFEGPGLPGESTVVRTLVDAGVAEFVGGTAHALHLTFDGGATGATLDLRPTLPLILYH